MILQDPKTSNFQAPMNTLIQWSLGLMSGTSLDGIDVALIRTDGRSRVEQAPWLTFPYDDAFRTRLRGLMDGLGDALAIEHELTLRHAQAVKALLQSAGMRPEEIRVIGFHGQTITHRPQEGITWQIGDGALLAHETGIDVVCDLRRADVAAGGQGAPIVPLYHAALSADMPKPLAILNIGGVANVTYIGEESLLAFDTGPGNALLNEWALRHIGAAMDEGGALALQGTADEALLARWLEDDYFTAKPPKSLDRNRFLHALAMELSPEDGAATLTAFTVESIARALAHFPESPAAWYVCGGGVHNPALMVGLQRRLGNVKSTAELGWQADALEAQAMAYLAMRNLQGLPLTLPGTTGVKKLVTGGALYKSPVYQ